MLDTFASYPWLLIPLLLSLALFVFSLVIKKAFLPLYISAGVALLAFAIPGFLLGLGYINLSWILILMGCVLYFGLFRERKNNGL